MTLRVKQDFAEELAALHLPVREGGFLQRKHGIHPYWPELATQLVR